MPSLKALSQLRCFARPDRRPVRALTGTNYPRFGEPRRNTKES